VSIDCRYNATRGFCNYDSVKYYYPLLKQLGLNYQVSLADAGTNLNAANNDSIKIIDHYFRAIVYKHLARHDPSYRATVFAYSDGNALDYFPYEAGGRDVADPADSANNFYFGGKVGDSWYYSPFLQTGDATIGDRNYTDYDSLNQPFKTVYAGIEDDDPGYLLCANISPLYMDTHRAGHEYYLDIHTRINQIGGQPENDTVAIVYLNEPSNAERIV
jgi:hypothetical protein